MSKPKISFLAFFLLWAELQGWKVPTFHIQVCIFLENFYLNGRTALLMMPRGHSKSSMLDVFNAWVIYCWPETQILHQGTTDSDAYKCSKGTRDVLERHPLCASNHNVAIRQGEIERWFVNGTNDVRYGTMLAKGILSGVTGHRAHFIQNDDVETPQTTANPEQREKLPKKLSEQTHIAIPGAKKLWIGTPHTYDSLYEKIKKQKRVSTFILKMFEHEKRVENGEKGQKVLLDFEPIHSFAGIGIGAKYLTKNVHYTCVNKGGTWEVTLLESHYVIDFYSKGIWEERFTPAEMEIRREECKTLNEWDSQYQMHAKPIGDVRLDPDKILAYDCEPYIKRANGELILMLGDRQMVGCSLKWDPSSGKLKSDVSSVALFFHDALGNKYWHRSISLTGPDVITDEGGNIVGGQVWQLCDLIQEFNVPRVVVETNGIGGFAPSSLKGALKKRGIQCGVTEQHAHQNKNKRILEAMEGPLMSGLLWAHISVLEVGEGENVEDSPQVKQMREWNPALSNQPDDYMDSAAGAIVEQPERIGKIHNKNTVKEAVNWRTNGGVYEATVDFD
ncbi:phage terminase large subunit [Acinetobacter baumannii]|uniref:phage terminase large subunit n=1 Tax=Acinetobacter baumannii TaxID=470 RepID=UPI0007A54072|nr:phage terminase large subunit [Acinetobacter baumannii]EHU1763532.1 phage terminase large subunit [Acinetobacter baumannii]EHU1766348.1 phage terminase large subunit [Acinetobacter baumannii]EHU2662299.1 phage terminase large subunit [Acinetobacter baumannii]EHU2902730.1 phage terminase large subunit [Acinetobacter baumannii]EHU2905331.1 phage terminase large subunit [Acinetobacter baumannii]